ncbi:hypothetical protein FOA52_001766 [Chlamydomonas sp. UWO 241]|nr:hypothetical protein FOA52_001766 [Chlamydomonas sp. UWO 241]
MGDDPYNPILGMVFLYQNDMRLFLTLVLFLALSNAYHYAAFMPAICDYGSGDYGCGAMDRAFKSATVVAGINTVVVAINIAVCLYSFFAQRVALWKRISLGEVTFSDNEILRGHFNVAYTEKTGFVNKEFVSRWRRWDESSSDEEMFDSANAIFRLVGDESHSPSGITRTEFDLFAARYRVPEDTVNEMWCVLRERDAPEITVASIYGCIYRLNFERKRFANMIYTDGIVTRWIPTYGAIVLHVLGAIIILDICGYSSAFGSGVDLFKIYLVGLTYFVGMLKVHIQFVVKMVTIRPFNVGDILVYDGDIWHVHSITNTQTILEGKHRRTVSNTLIDRDLVNLSVSDSINDSISIALPITHADTLARVQYHVNQYHRLDHVSAIINIGKSVRCEYVDGGPQAPPDSRTVKVSYAYTSNMMNRSQLLWAHAHFANYLSGNMEREAGGAWLAYSAAAGGAYNHLYTLD